MSADAPVPAITREALVETMVRAALVWENKGGPLNADHPGLLGEPEAVRIVARRRADVAWERRKRREDFPHLVGAMGAALAAAESSLSHPAALERARAEERERCALLADEWDCDRLSPPDSWEPGTVSAYEDGANDASISIAAAIRALGPRPSPEAEPPGHIDLMVPPESIDAFMKANPLPPEPAMTPDLRPLAEWHEDIGDVLWWRAGEAPWVGSPLVLGFRVELNDVEIGGWPGDDYFAGWTPLPDAPRALLSELAPAAQPDLAGERS